MATGQIGVTPLDEAKGHLQCHRRRTYVQMLLSMMATYAKQSDKALAHKELYNY
jgi:hypothetical protein